MASLSGRYSFYSFYSFWRYAQTFSAMHWRLSTVELIHRTVVSTHCLALADYSGSLGDSTRATDLSVAALWRFSGALCSFCSYYECGEQS